MTTTHQSIPPTAIPDWFLETVRVMQDTDHGLRNIETELRYAMRLKSLDPRLREEMQSMLDALGAVKVSLSVMDLSARQVLGDLARRFGPDPRQAAH